MLFLFCLLPFAFSFAFCLFTFDLVFHRFSISTGSTASASSKPKTRE